MSDSKKKRNVLGSKIKYWIENISKKQESKPISDGSVKTTKRKKKETDANVSSTFLVEIGKNKASNKPRPCPLLKRKTFQAEQSFLISKKLSILLNGATFQNALKLLNVVLNYDNGSHSFVY